MSVAAMPLPLSTTWAVLASLGASVSSDDGVFVVTADLPGHRWARALSVLDPGRVDEARHWLDRAADEFPTLAHPAIGLPGRPDREVWRQQPCRSVGGTALEWWPQHWMALEAQAVEPVQPLPNGYRVVPVGTPAEWEQFAAIPSAGGEDYQRT